MSDTILAVVIILIILMGVALCYTAVTVCEQASCTTTRLTNSSFIVCKYKDKVLFNGEIKDED